MYSPRILACLALSTTWIVMICCTPRPATHEQIADSTHVDADTVRMRSDSIQSITPTPTETPVDTIQITELGPEYNDPEWDDSLKKYFTPVQVVRIKLAKEQFQKIATVSDLARFYRITLPAVATIMETQINAITPTESSGDNSPAPHWAWFPQYFAVLSSDVLCSECSYSPMVELKPIQAKAAATPGKEDDLFFDLANIVYSGRYEAHSSIYNADGWSVLVDCDLCAASTLGSGKRVDMLNAIERAASAHVIFGQEMDAILNAVLMVHDNYYYYDKETVLVELDKMLASRILTAEQKTTLQNYRKEIIAKSFFNCSAGNCEWPA